MLLRYWSILTNRVRGDLDLNTTIVFGWVMGGWQMGKSLLNTEDRGEFAKGYIKYSRY